MPASLAALRRVLGVRRLLGIQAAYLAFRAVDLGTWVAVLVYAYGATGPASVGLVGVVQLVPAAILAPFVATLAERAVGRWALTLAYALVATTMAAVGFAMLAGWPTFVVYALAVVAQISLPSIRPLQAAILPALVGTAEQLTATNALSTVLDGLGALLGPLLAGVGLEIASPGAVLVAGGAVAAVACVAVAVSSRSAWTPGAPLLTPASRTADPRPGLLEGFRRVASDRASLWVVAVLGARQVVTGALDVLLILAAIQLLAMGESGAGYLSAGIGMGAMVGGASTLALVGRPRMAGYLFLGSAAWAAFLLVVAAVPGPTVAIIFLGASGLGLAVVDVTGQTLLQRLTPIRNMTAVFGVAEASIMAGLAVGCLAVGPVVGQLGVAGAMTATGLLLPGVALAALPVVVPAERKIRVPVREIVLLRRLRMFAPVPAPTLEAVARRLEPVGFPAGATVMAEGEAGDCFYAIASGSVRVSRAGREVARLGPGDGFGEIALLRRVPRTATVEAVTPVELLGLRRDDFLEAVTGTPQALEAATRLAETRVPVGSAERSAIGADAEVDPAGG